jgi:hypothetical protein
MRCNYNHYLLITELNLKQLIVLVETSRQNQIQIIIINELRGFEIRGEGFQGVSREQGNMVKSLRVQKYHKE